MPNSTFPILSDGRFGCRLTHTGKPNKAQRATVSCIAHHPIQPQHGLPVAHKTAATRKDIKKASAKHIHENTIPIFACYVKPLGTKNEKKSLANGNYQR